MGKMLKSENNVWRIFIFLSLTIVTMIATLGGTRLAFAATDPLITANILSQGMELGTSDLNLQSRDSLGNVIKGFNNGDDPMLGSVGIDQRMISFRADTGEATIELAVKGQIPIVPPPALYVVLTIDISYSMNADEKLIKTKEASEYLVREILDKDRPDNKNKIAIVIYGTDATELIGWTGIDDMNKIIEAIEGLEAENMNEATNIQAGFHAVNILFGKAPVPTDGGAFVKHVILLSDGLPTICYQPEPATRTRNYITLPAPQNPITAWAVAEEDFVAVIDKDATSFMMDYAAVEGINGKAPYTILYPKQGAYITEDINIEVSKQGGDFVKYYTTQQTLPTWNIILEPGDDLEVQSEPGVDIDFKDKIIFDNDRYNSYFENGPYIYGGDKVGDGRTTTSNIILASIYEAKKLCDDHYVTIHSVGLNLDLDNTKSDEYKVLDGCRSEKGLLLHATSDNLGEVIKQLLVKMDSMVYKAKVEVEIGDDFTFTGFVDQNVQPAGTYVYDSVKKTIIWEGFGNKVGKELATLTYRAAINNSGKDNPNGTLIIDKSAKLTYDDFEEVLRTMSFPQQKIYKSTLSIEKRLTRGTGSTAQPTGDAFDIALEGELESTKYNHKYDSAGEIKKYYFLTSKGARVGWRLTLTENIPANANYNLKNILMNNVNFENGNEFILPVKETRNFIVNNEMPGITVPDVTTPQDGDDDGGDGPIQSIDWINTPSDDTEVTISNHANPPVASPAEESPTPPVSVADEVPLGNVQDANEPPVEEIELIDDIPLESPAKINPKTGDGVDINKIFFSIILTFEFLFVLCLANRHFRRKKTL